MNTRKYRKEYNVEILSNNYEKWMHKYETAHMGSADILSLLNDWHDEREDLLTKIQSLEINKEEMFKIASDSVIALNDIKEELGRIKLIIETNNG